MAAVLYFLLFIRGQKRKDRTNILLKPQREMWDLRLLREIKAPSPTEPEKPEAEEPTDRQKSVEQGIDNLMTYDLNTMKASLKGREV